MTNEKTFALLTIDARSNFGFISPHHSQQPNASDVHYHNVFI